MKLSRTLMMTAAATILSTAAMAEGTTNHSTTGSMNEQSPTESYAPQSGADAGTSASTGASTNVQATANIDSQTIQSVQASLNNAGHSLSADGVWGPQTASALRQFQQENGLTPTGSIDSQTLAALDVDRGM